MDISEFTGNDKIVSFIQRAEKLKTDGKRFSDIEDDKGNQYVDLVQEGGGVLGIALVGYTYILENCGIRFFSLAGTSAGAINTMVLAGLGKIEEPKSERILEIISNKSFFDFVDGGNPSKRVIEKALSGKDGIGWTLIWNGIQLFHTIKRKLGLNPGDDFKNWLSRELNKAGIKSLSDLKALRMQIPQGLHNVIDGAEVNDLQPKLAIISSEISTHTKVIFPEMAGLYWNDPENISPSEFVRASMSIPFFFEPYIVDGLPHEGQEEAPEWVEMARYYGPVPGSVKFVDGGLLSNFPINVFHREDGGIPRMPTFGARLSAYREEYSKTDNLLGFSGGMISTMRQIYDLDFILRNPDFRQLICRIKADKKFNWLDFFMEDNKKVELFNLGAQKAIEFLESFDWEGYKGTRKQISMSKK